MAGGTVAAALRGDRLRIIEKGASERTVVFPDYVECIQWSSASGTLRLTMFNLKTDIRSLWDLRDIHAQPHPLPDYPGNAKCGAWTPQGYLFVFQAQGQTGGDLWG